VLSFAKRRLKDFSAPIDLLQRGFTVIEPIEKLDRLDLEEGTLWIARWLEGDCRVEEVERAFERMRDTPAAAVSERSKQSRLMYGHRGDARSAVERDFGALKGSRLVFPAGTNRTPLRCHALAFSEGVSGPVSA
jgi:hypothetical protein